MSRQNFRRQHFNHPQGSYPIELPAATVMFPAYSQPYVYENHGYEYYEGIHQYPQPSEYWYREDAGYSYSTTPTIIINSTFSPTHSTFSPDAPEFVSKHSQVLEEKKIETLVQQPTKKKKKKKKKASNTPKTNTACDGAEETAKNIVLPSNVKEKKVVDVKKLDQPKSVRFRDELFTEEKAQSQKRKPKPQDNISLVKNKVCDSWPEPSATFNKSPENRQPKVSFADKLKSPAPTRSPFLDWRDQRTNAVNEPIKPRTIVYNEENVSTLPTTPNPAKEISVDDGFITVYRKKSKDKKSQSVAEEVTKSPSDTKDANKILEIDAKKKLEKERKKLREKEKKKRARDDKLLAEKLAPKGQKVTIITPKLMEKFLQSSRSASASSKPIIKLSDDMFPALGKRDVGVKSNVSESESEWETTEIEMVKKEEPFVPRSVKRTDPIQFDLMALITKKSNKKKMSTTSESVKKNKNRPGLVANVLDRSAPTLSRGKIRNKKRKLSEIRKALLAAKAKRKAARESQLSNLPSSGARPHVLHSKKFREYCDQMLTDQIDLLSRDMLYHLRMFQDRVYKKDPIKARMKKRLVAGLREVTKQVERNRVKIIFLAPDIQRCPETGGLDEAVKRLLDTARRLDLPIVYALSRRKIGRVLMKKVPVSCCGILNYQATEETWKKLTEAVTNAREQYQLKLQQLGLDTTEKETQLDTPAAESIATPSVKKQPVETDTLLELMKLSLKEKP